MEKEEKNLLPNRHIEIKNIEYFNSVERFLKCYLCNDYFDEPKHCNICHNIYCKKCLDSWNKKNKENKCPNDCKNPTYSDDEIAIQLLNAIELTCLDCGENMGYIDINNEKKHQNKKCINEIYRIKCIKLIEKYTESKK